MELMDLVRTVDEHWQFRLANTAAYSVQNKYEVFVYNAFEVVFHLERDSIRIGITTLDPEPGPLPDITIAVDELSSTIASLDAKFRSALPAAYLGAFDAWVTAQSELAQATAGRKLSPQERRALMNADAPASDAAAGPAIAFDEVPRILEEYFGARLSAVRPSGVSGEQALTARIDGRLTIGISRNAQYGAYAAAIMQHDRATGVLLGKRLIARHDDEASIRELLQIIDEWLHLRLNR